MYISKKRIILITVFKGTLEYGMNFKLYKIFNACHNIFKNVFFQGKNLHLFKILYNLFSPLYNLMLWD